jgi:PAS domain S-box-containing protein
MIRRREMASGAADPDLLGNSVFDAIPDGIVIADLEGRITYVNQHLAQLSGYSAADLVGKPVEALIPEAARSQHPAHRAAYVRAGLPTRPMGTNLRTRLLTREGGEVPVDISLRRLEGAGPVQVLAAVRDATERNRAQARIEAMLEVSQHILRGEPADEVLSLVARRARELIGASLAMVALPAPGGQELVVEVADGFAEDQLRGGRLPVHHSLAGEVFRSGRSLVVENVIGDPRSVADLARTVGYGPCIVVPLKAGGAPFGALTVANLQGGSPFQPEALQVVELFAIQASVAIEYSRVREELARLALVEDRERIGRELHDGVIQSLFGVGMNLQASAEIAGPGELQDRLQVAVGELDRAIRDLRNYIFGLRPGILADRRLSQAIAQLAEDTEEQSGIAVAVAIDPQVAAELASAAGDVVQMVRESLSNVARHSGAETCRVSLARDEAGALLLVEDDGHGFDPGSVARGQGLGNLRERAEGLQGTLAIVAVEGQGTRVEIRLPL